jgi:predicted dehydrogenase
METNQSPTVGVVGLGEIGRVYAAIASERGCAIVGAEADQQARARFEDVFGFETYDDFEAMYRDGVDIALITTPNRYHEGPARSALEFGIDTMIEKPLANDAESAARIAEYAERSDAHCDVSYYLRFHECVRELDRYLDSDYFGDITHVEARYVYRRGVPRRGSWYTSKDIAGGGVLQDKGSFLLALLEQFGFDLSTLDSVTARARTEFGDRGDYTAERVWGGTGHEDIFDVEDSVSAFLEFEDGSTVTMETAWAMNGGTEHVYRLRGTEGGAELDLREGVLTVYGIDRDEGRLPRTEHTPELPTHSLNEDGEIEADLYHTVLQSRVFEQFLASRAAAGEEVAPGLDRAVRVQRSIADIYDAAGVSYS